MADCAYTEDGKYFSIISSDGRLRVWDTESNTLKQEYTPDLHLTSPTTCLQWITVKNSTDSTRKASKRKSSGDHESQCIALGTTSGKILIYSVTQAKIESTLEDTKNTDIQTSNVTSLDWHRKYGLFSSNKDNFVSEWDINECNVKNKYNVNVDSKKQVNSVSAIKIVPHDQNSQAKFLVTASKQLRLWSLHNGTAILLRNMGHSDSTKAVLTLATLQNKCCVIEGSHNERLLNFWDVTITSDQVPKDQVNGDTALTPRKQRRKSMSEVQNVPTPTYSFALVDSPSSLDLVIEDVEGGTRMALAATTRSGVVHYFGQMLNGASTKPIKPSVTIRVTTKGSKAMPVQCCKFTKLTTDKDAAEMVLGYETTPGRLMFERVTPETKKKSQVLVREDPSLESSKKKKRKEEVKKERTDATEEQKITYLEPAGGVVRKRAAPGGSVEVPMEARLANLALDPTHRSKSAVSHNLTKLLVQGLHSKDKALTLSVLQRDEQAVASRTVASLPPDYVPKLLDQLVDMASRKTVYCSAVCTWLSALLRHHAALLLATLHTPTTGDKLAQLLAVLTQRRSHLCQLLNLSGRLELTQTQRKADHALRDEQPLLDYNDSSSEEEEMEIENAQSDAESWTEEQFEASDASDHSDGGD